MKLHKRKKFTRLRGTRTHGWAMKKHKGKGNKGGWGMSGTGKRADQRKTWVIKYQYPYFGKKGFTSRSTARKINKVMNIEDIEKLVNSGRARNGILELKDYKILGDGNIGSKIKVLAGAFSKSAKEKIEKAGGEVILAKLATQKEGKSV